ncbi:Ig-like domain-containing protein [Neobacillus drentensis]|uniref:Ig-like domain-containing protein n=1 Tax=Neobacillus drentensis TaxID=220684 RepID=UPI0008252CF4|nr:Ig-like domain-containing protein [Neobacillus drentensis]
MRNKDFLSLVAVGLLVSTLSVGTVKAEGNEYELSKKLVERQVGKPIQQGIIDSHTLDQLEKEVKGSQSYSAKGFNKMGATSSSISGSEVDDYMFETEPNDEFDYADDTSYEKLTIGQLLPLYDVDIHKVVVPKDGILLVAGGTNSSAIDLGFGAVQKDFIENDKLVYLGSDYDENGFQYKAYQAKGGTYYIGVIDNDNDLYDDNTEEDFYVLATGFVDNVAPNKPIVNKVDNNDTVVTGKAEPGSTVTVKRGNTVLATAKAASNRVFSAKIAVQKAGTKLAITAKDSAGNVSASVTLTVADVIAPNRPTVNKVDDNDRKVTGKAEANSRVTVKVGNKTLGSAYADSKGKYSVKIKAQKKGTTLAVTAKDKAGNQSSKRTIKVVKH